MVIRGIETGADRQAVRQLLTAEFDVRPGVGAAFARLYDGVLDGDRREACSRVAVVAGRVVGHALLAPRPFCIDGVAVPGGILAMVVVAPGFRGRGIGSRLVQDVEACAAKQGLLWLHLAGDPGFYRRFGYVEGYLKCRADLDLAGVAGPAPPNLRPAVATDAVELARLSRCEVPTGAAEPEPERWRWVLETGHPAGLLKVNDILLGFCAEEDFCWVLDEGGEIRGLVRAAGGGGRLALYEAAVVDTAAAGRALEAVCALAGRLGYGRLVLHLPPGNRLMEAAGRVRMQTGTDPELLIKLLDAPGLMARLRPLLDARFEASVASAWSGRVALCTERDRFLLVCEGGRLQVQAVGEAEAAQAGYRLSLPEMGLARAFLGTDRLAERVGRQKDADSDLLALLDALFPLRSPFFWLADSL